MQPTKDQNGRDCIKYDSFEEVSAIACHPPRFCEKCGKELLYWSFYDARDRFTLKAGCVTCRTANAIAINRDKYKERMLKRWATKVKERTNYRCEMASPKCKGVLHAHHIIPKHIDPDKMYDIENGMCLCEAHHKMIHGYM